MPSGFPLWAPAAQAGLLGGSDDSDSIGLPVAGDLLGGDLLGGLLGGGLLGGLLVGGLLGGPAGGLPLVGGLLGGDCSAVFRSSAPPRRRPSTALVGGLPARRRRARRRPARRAAFPLVGGILGEDGVLGGEMLDVVTDTTLSCDAAIPQVLCALFGEVTDAVCEPFSYGLFGLLGSL